MFAGLDERLAAWRDPGEPQQQIKEREPLSKLGLPVTSLGRRPSVLTRIFVRKGVTTRSGEPQAPPTWPRIGYNGPHTGTQGRVQPPMTRSARPAYKLVRGLFHSWRGAQDSNPGKA
jgi:hypothetical protein